jgi:hypothetical protein
VDLDCSARSRGGLFGLSTAFSDNRLVLMLGVGMGMIYLAAASALLASSNIDAFLYDQWHGRHRDRSGY